MPVVILWGFCSLSRADFCHIFWRIYHGNVRLLVLAVCVQGLAGRSVYKGYSYDMERVSYCKTRGKKKNNPHEKPEVIGEDTKRRWAVIHIMLDVMK